MLPIIPHLSLFSITAATLAAFIAGLIDTIAGGGGLIILPTLLMLGFSPQMALGTNKFQACFGSGTAAYRFYKTGQVRSSDLELLFGILMTFIGASIGTLCILVLSGDFLKKIIPWLLLLALIYILAAPQKYLQGERAALINKYFFLMLFGIGLGFYDGFFGPGTGSLWAVLIMIFLGLDLKNATMHAKIFNFSSNLAALAWFIWAQHVDYELGFFMGIGQTIGAIIGSLLVLHRGTRLIRPVFICMVSVMIILLIIKNNGAVF